jgi:8-oxo-dGTP pyrophosphatase MutT (NUDIX family)
MALLGFSVATSSDDWRDASVLLTRRTETVETHKGQVAFPGGHQDPEDPGFIEAALRETEEEVGIARSEVEVVGALPRLWTRTGYLVTPVVGVLHAPIEEVALTPSPDEIAAIFWAPVRALLARENYVRELLVVDGRQVPLHSFQLGEHRVWGITGGVIRNLLDRLEAASTHSSPL